jgi:hypothetical protein
MTSNPGWQKGKSGNPGGRPKALLDFIEKARKLSDVSLGVLARALNSEDGRVRILAAREILDRAWGKPTQAVTGQDGAPLFAGSPELLEVLRRMVNKG